MGHKGEKGDPGLPVCSSQLTHLSISVHGGANQWRCEPNSFDAYPVSSLLAEMLMQIPRIHHGRETESCRDFRLGFSSSPASLFAISCREQGCLRGERRVMSLDVSILG